MSYSLILTLGTSLLLSGCSLISQINKHTIDKPIVEKEKTIEKRQKSVVEQKPITIIEKKKTEVKNLTTKPTNSSIIKDKYSDYDLIITDDPNKLEGNYSLERGQISFAGARKDIIQSKLVIEKLGVKDYGYYYNIKVKDYPSNEYFGIFTKKDGKYVQKVISDNGEVSYYDNIELIHEDRRVKLTINTNQGKRIIIWNKVDYIEDTKTLEGAKKIYNQVCKANYCE
jgi:hypothetical protein